MMRISMVLLIATLVLACGGVPEEKAAEKESTEKFNDLADEEGFAESHDEPLELDVSALGSMQKIPMEAGNEANIYSVKREGTKNFVLVFHEWWGLNNHIVAEADRLYNELSEVDVTVIAIDLYDGNVATSRERAGELMKSSNTQRCENIIASVLNEIPDDANIVTIGWCFGGGWSLKGALAAGNRTKGCVMYYGMPVEDTETLKELNSDVMFIYAEQDEWINQDVVDKFKVNMKSAGKELNVLSFDADHAFANPSSEKFKEQAAQKANVKTVEYLNERLFNQ